MHRRHMSDLCVISTGFVRGFGLSIFGLTGTHLYNTLTQPGIVNGQTWSLLVLAIVSRKAQFLLTSTTPYIPCGEYPRTIDTKVPKNRNAPPIPFHTISRSFHTASQTPKKAPLLSLLCRDHFNLASYSLLELDITWSLARIRLVVRGSQFWYSAYTTIPHSPQIVSSAVRPGRLIQIALQRVNHKFTLISAF